MSVALAYLAGLFTLPGCVFVGWLIDKVRAGSWTVPTAVCRHSGPPKLSWAWRWHCDTEVGDDGAPCGALWVRQYVTRFVPRRVLWPREPREQENV